MTTFRKLNNNEAFDPITGKRMHDGGNSLVRAWIDSLPPLEPVAPPDMSRRTEDAWSRAEVDRLKRSLCDAQSDASSFMEQLHELQERVNTKSDYERGFDVGFSCGREGRADSVSKMHRRAQRAESDVALMNRQARRWKHAYERMTQVVCDAWDALPVHIREEIESPMLPSGAILPQPRDLVRGVSMLADETRTCDVCGATGELDSRCGRCIR